MSFSDYVLKYLNEEEVDMNAELTKMFIKVKNPAFKKFLTNNILSFAIKSGELKNSNPKVQYHKNYEPLLISELEKCKVPYEIITKNDRIIKIKEITFRQTSKAIESYWNSSGSGNKTNNQELGVGIWILILSNNGQKLEDFVKLGLDKKLVCDNKDDITKALDFLKVSQGTPNGWNQQCKTSAEVVIKNLGNLRGYQVHQGGDFFNSLRKKGSNLSDLNPDKWNPSDIYLVKGNYKSALTSRTIEELNSRLNKFDDIIGISLKGAEALHGAASLTTIFKKLKIKDPRVTKWEVKADSVLSEKQKRDLKELLFKIRKQSRGSSYDVGVFISSKSKAEKSNDIDTLLNGLRVESANWGQSLPITLGYLCELKTPEQWDKFIFRAYCVASSKTFESASYYKAEGNGHFEKCIPGLDEKKFKCNRCRIEISGGTAVIFDAEYDGTALKLQFRSKGSRPQMNVIHTQESAWFKPLIELKGF